MDIRKFFPVEIKKDQESKQLINTNTSTTDNEKPLIEYKEEIFMTGPVSKVEKIKLEI